MTKIRTIIIEDEPLARQRILAISNQLRELDVIEVFDNPLPSIELIKSGHVDLIISDIQMPDIDGISFLKSLSQPPNIIFVTAYPEFAPEGFELDVLDYILKPQLSEERLLKAVQKVQRAMAYGNTDKGTKEYIKFRDRDKTLFLSPEEILFIEAWGDYVKVNTTEGVLIQLFTMKEMEEKLPWTSFIRIHRSYIINTLHLKSTNSRKVTLKNGQILNIGLKYRSQFYKHIGVE